MMTISATHHRLHAVLITTVFLSALIMIYVGNATDYFQRVADTPVDSSFTPIPVTGECIDNTKKVAVYIPRMANPMSQVSTGRIISTDIMYDPLCTAMFFEYNPDYLNDTTIATKLTPANYNLLIVPMQEISDAAVTAINNYLVNGGCVWFLADPSLSLNGSENAERIDILGNPCYSSFNSINSFSNIVVDNSDDITRGLPSLFSPVGAISKHSYFRELKNSGEISGFKYKVLMNNGDCALMIKYENNTTGARAIYSNPYMFVSGGDCSYFNSQTATKLFLQTKAWMLKMAQNSGGVQVTYPKSDKQLTITFDDVSGTSAQGTNMQPLFGMETERGIDPKSVNTFFITLDPVNTIKTELQYYATNGDIHTLHPHNGIIWDDNKTMVANYTNAIINTKAKFNEIMGVSDYGFTSWRFPMTTFCTNSMQAVSDSGFLIESSSGLGTSGITIGTRDDNNLLFPKQIIVSSIKANAIECELTSVFDINAGSGANFYQYYNAQLPYLKNVNFPANFVVGAHYQGAGIHREYIDGMSQILDASKATGTSYATFDTLAKYINGVKKAKISGSASNGITTVTVASTNNIDNFTLKVTNMNTISAKFDNVPIPPSEIIQDGKVWYIVHTVSAGTHKFIIQP